jgi:hypothetical protein
MYTMALLMYSLKCMCIYLNNREQFQLLLRNSSHDSTRMSLTRKLVYYGSIRNLTRFNFCSTLKHPHIVQFFGIHTSTLKEKYIVLESMSEGGLDKMLRQKQGEITHVDLLHM